MGLERYAEVVRAHIEEQNLLDEGDRVVVAFSGGADSTALALLLRHLGFDTCLAHVDHQMRSTSGDDAAHCRTIAQRLEVAFDAERVEVDPPTEANARVVRYAALVRIARRQGALKIATGHTLGDQIETLLMRLGRGGFALGIPVTRGRIIRPILGLGREHTEAICRDQGIPYVEDPTNTDERFRRNLIRRRVVPVLDDETKRVLLEIGEVNRAAVAKLDEEVERARGAGALSVSSGRAEIDRSWLDRASPQARRASLRWALTELGIDGSVRLVEDLEKKVAPITGARIDLPKGLAAWAEPRFLILGAEEPPFVPSSFFIEVPGVVRSRDWGIEIEATTLKTPSVTITTNPFEACLDWESIGAPIAIRARRQGDRFVPLGGPGPRKLQDFFVDQKVPRRLRDRVPLVVAGNEVVWIAGFRIDDRFKVTAATNEVLRLRVFPLLRGDSHETYHRDLAKAAGS